MTQPRFAHGAFLLLAPFGAAIAATPVDRLVPADPTGTLEVHNVAGSVEVIGGNRRDVHVTGTLGDNVERLDVSTDGDRVIVKVVVRDDWRSRSWDDTRLTVEAPAAMELNVNTVSAGIEVRGSEGEQRLRSVSGNVVTNGFARDLDASSVSGNLTVRGDGARDGTTRVKSVSGRVTVEGIAGEIQAESVSGRVDVTASSLDRARLSSISGDVTLRGGLANDSRIEAETTSGDVTLVISGDAAAEYELSSFSGNIRNCFGPPPPAPSSSGTPGRQHRFREGDSDARVRANTLSGTIEVCR